MIQVTFLDGAVRDFEKGSSCYDVARSISASLAKSALLAKVDGVLVDIDTKLLHSCNLEIITSKNKEEILPVVRHDLAHLMAQAVNELFPGTKFSIGPSTENGFFYDFYRSEPFKESDLEIIETKMKSMIDEGYDVTREDVTKVDAKKRLTESQEKFKLAILDNIDAEYVSFYKQGNFEDLCRGPHLKNTKKLPKSFKLYRLSSVYFNNSSENESMQRIAAIAFLNNDDLDNFFKLKEELQERDHRRIGKDMELFHLQEEAAGSVFWHQKGWELYRVLENYIREKLSQSGYIEVKTPQLISKSLWEKSGHWEKFNENMFVIQQKEDMEFALKPMNCPAHIEIFKNKIKSYKELPLRMAEFGCCHRNEPSGSLHGIMRVRGFTQDDAHIFCTEDQITSETKQFCDLLQEVYKEIFGDIKISVKFSDRPEKRAGDDATWDKAEQALLSATKAAGLEVVLNKGEGAFYGPKLEFAIKDALGRDWQLGTLQADFILPERLNASYVTEEGTKKRPAMLHRAILGSLERFIGILIEHYKGRFPLWLCPLQVVVATISDSSKPYAQEVYEALQNAGVKTLFDPSSNKIGYKIREHTLQKIPYIIVVGKKEAESGMLNIRVHGKEENLILSLDSTIELLKNNINNKSLNY